jgi:small subunit ribosomal protein S16
LKRTGTRNASCFRVVVMDQRSSRDGKAIEELGFYDPRKKEEKINVERAAYWKSVGAEFSETVDAILNRAKDGRNLKDIVKKPSLSKKAKAKIEAEAAAKAAAKAEAEAAAKAAAEAPAAEEAPAVEETPAEAASAEA